LTAGLNLSTIGLVMSTDIQNGVAAALFGKVRCAVLALLFTHSDQTYYLREIARLIGMSHGAVQRELGNLEEAGLVVRFRRGNQSYFQANTASPVFPELRGLVTKTVGVADVMRGALAGLAERVKVAFIYGSVARGEEKSTSDVDVMVIGDVGFGEVVSALRPAQDQLGREVNPSVFGIDEITRRITDRDHFITSVIDEEKVFLVGDEHDLRGLA
jgi:uncharacterized protein